MELGNDNVGQVVSGNSPPEVASKSEFKRKLVSLQVRASALGRQLKLVAAGHKPVSDVSKGFNEEWRDCFELVSLVRADILACDGDNPGDFDDLDKLACRVEDVLFEQKGDLSNLKAKDEVSGPSAGSTASLLGASKELPMRVPVDVESLGQVPIVPEASGVKQEKPPSLLQGYPGSELGLGRREPKGAREGTHMPNLNPHAVSFCSPRNTGVGFPLTLGSNAPLSVPPAPRLALENFNGDIIKYWDFKKRFKRHVEAVYPSYEDRMAFLESLCVGKARNVIAGIGCLLDSRMVRLGTG